MWPRIFPRGLPGYVPLFHGWPRARTPALVGLRLRFACGETALAGYRPHLLGLPRKIARGISLRETTLCGCPLRGHDFATPHQYFAVPVTALPRRVPNGKNPALAPVRSHFACGETGLAGRCPRWGQRARYPIFALLKCGPAYSRGVCRGTFLCSTAGPALAPRRSSAYASVSPAAKPRWPVTGPTFWVCRAKSRAAFRCAKPPWPMFWPVLFIGQKMRYSVLAGFSSISQCR